MAQGLAVALPLYIDSIDGAYGLHKNLESANCGPKCQRKGPDKTKHIY